MSDNIVFHDFDVTVEIYDSVMAKWVLTDYAETDPESTAYLRNRDLIQPKLTAGTNVSISAENEISVELPDMNLYASKEELLTESARLLDDAVEYADSVTSAQVLDAGFASYDTAVLQDVSAQAIGNSKLLITFTPVANIVPEETPYTAFSDAITSILPTLRLRFGHVWDYSTVSQVGFCVLDQDGDLTLKAVETLSAGKSYTLIV